MSYKEIPTLLNTCKNIAKAYHSSVNFARAVHEAQIKVLTSFEQFYSYFNIKVQSRDESQRPWAILQEVSTRWNSQLICLRSCLKSEAALRSVLSSGEFKTMKSLAGVKFSQSQVDLLKRVCHVLEPFYQATLQLSNDGSCISEVLLWDITLNEISGLKTRWFPL